MKKVLSFLLVVIMLIPFNAYASDGIGTILGNENIKYQFNTESGNLIIYGNGEIKDYVKSPFDIELEKITSVTINDGITKIGKRIFRNCVNVNTFIIGNTVSDIDISAFDGCTNINEFIVYSNNSSFTSVDGVLYSNDLSKLIKYPTGKTDETFTTISSNQYILKDAFKGSSFLKKVNLSNDIKEVNEDFSKLGIECSKVNSVVDNTVNDNNDGNSNHEHKFTYISVTPTCTEFGYCQKICDECGADYVYKYIAPNGHTFEKEKNPATFNKDGHIYIKCRNCGYIEKDNLINKIDKAYLNLERVSYTGIPFSPLVTILDSEGNLLIKGTDYTYALPSNRKSVGKYTYNIKFKGNYQGETSLDFYVYPSETFLTYIILRQNEVELQWSKITAQCDGYVISYSTDPEFRSNVIYKYVNSKYKSSYKINDYHHKKIYFFRIRTYKTVGDRTYFSDWCDATGAKVL